jgi:hypothetical protein
MPAPPKTIDVPDPQPGSFNPNRRPGLLLQAQALHMREALVKHSEELAAVLAIDPKSLNTEGDISAYIHRATAILHTHWARPKGT